MAVAGIIRQQACGLRVWCPEEEEEEAATRSHEAGIQPASSLLLAIMRLSSRASRTRQSGLHQSQPVMLHRIHLLLGGRPVLSAFCGLGVEGLDSQNLCGMLEEALSLCRKRKGHRGETLVTWVLEGILTHHLLPK